MNRQKIELIEAVLAVIVLYGVMFLFGITCPIKFLTGISCPGCGMTRAIISLLKLDFYKAFYYHPLFWAPPLLLLVFYMKERISPRIYKGILYAAVVLFFAVYFYRLVAMQSDIVCCNVKSGAIYKLYQLIRVI